MDYREMFISLVAYCQRFGYLPTDEGVYSELADICDCDKDDIIEAID